MSESARHPAAATAQPDLFGVCDVRGSNLSGQPDHLPDEQSAGADDDHEGLLVMRGTAHNESGSAPSAIRVDVEPVACARCESNSHIYTASACCQARLQASIAAFPTYLAARELLVTRNIETRQESIRKFAALHGEAQAEKLKALFSSMWTKRGG